MAPRAKSPAPKPGTTVAVKKPRGIPPTAFRDDFVRIARIATIMGAIDEDLAEMFGVTRTTIKNWRRDKPGFAGAIAAGKDFADTRVERSLYERANGFSHPDVKILPIKGKAVKVPYTKVYPPEVAACIFWLKNRRPDRWRDKIELEHTIPDMADLLRERRERARLQLNGPVSG